MRWGAAMSPDPTPETKQELAFRSDCNCALDEQLRQLLADADTVRRSMVALSDVLAVLQTDPTASDAERAAFAKARNSLLFAFLGSEVPR
jgi:hypothetical protein